METLEEKIKELVNYDSVRYVTSFSSHLEGDMFMDVILSAYNEGKTAEEIKEKIKTALENRKPIALNLDKLKNEVDRSVTCIYQFLQYLTEKKYL